MTKERVGGGAPEPEERWQRRRVAAVSLRTAILIGPLLGSVAAMAVLSRALPDPGAHTGIALRLGWWAMVLAGSLAAMWLVDRATRRLAPLAALLDLAVLFPGRAPTRLKVARRVGDVRQLENVKQQARDVEHNRRGSDNVAAAAEQILALVGALRAHDRHTRGHSERVRVYTDLIAAELRLPPAAVDRLRWAALLHDIGKLRVPTTTLNKPAKLSNSEWELIRRHPDAGAELAGALLPWLGEWGSAIAEHHERFDGTGYPRGLAGRDISTAGRIVAVADSFEVMTAARAYKRAMTRSAALEELVRCSGQQFDPDIVRALLQVSAPRLRWAMGPMSWLVGIPVLGTAPSLTGAGVAAQAAAGMTSVAVAGVAGLAVPAAATTFATAAPTAQPAIPSTVAAADASDPRDVPRVPVITPRWLTPIATPKPVARVSPTSTATPTPTAAATPIAARPQPAAVPARSTAAAPAPVVAPHSTRTASAPATTPAAPPVPPPAQPTPAKPAPPPPPPPRATPTPRPEVVHPPAPVVHPPTPPLVKPAPKKTPKRPPWLLPIIPRPHNVPTLPAHGNGNNGKGKAKGKD
jgi:putative nucleotidyltransferase with HDIG domain